jgi:hypothetical protein
MTGPQGILTLRGIDAILIPILAFSRMPEEPLSLALKNAPLCCVKDGGKS